MPSQKWYSGSSINLDDDNDEAIVVFLTVYVGTDDDLLPPHHIRGTSGHPVGYGSIGTVVAYPRAQYDLVTQVQYDLETQVHKLEQEAYSSILRAFKAQSDSLTWEKESLITQLRVELRVSDAEHREILTMVNANYVIRSIRELRQTGPRISGLMSNAQIIHDPLPSPSISRSRKRKNTCQSVPSLSLNVPSVAMHPRAIGASVQPSSLETTHGATGAISKKTKPIPSTAPSGGSQFTTKGASGVLAVNELAETKAYDPVIDRKTLIGWFEDKKFDAAAITDYDPHKISPEDNRWDGQDSGFSLRREAGLGIKKPPGRGSLKNQSKKDLTTLQNGLGKKGSNPIKIIRTETLIKEVERVFCASHFDFGEVERAKKLLKEHEQALVDAIARLADASDGENGS